MTTAEAARPAGWRARFPALPYVAPFAVFIAMMALERILPGGIETLYPLRLAVVLAVLVVFSRGVLDFRTQNALGSIALGVAVFAIWIAPDVLWPQYRSHWL